MTEDRRDATDDRTETQEAGDAEVEGHLNPTIARDLASARQQDLHARADRDRQARSAAGTGRDGGMLDKIRRFTRREG